MATKQPHLHTEAEMLAACDEKRRELEKYLGVTLTPVIEGIFRTAFIAGTNYALADVRKTLEGITK